MKLCGAAEKKSPHSMLTGQEIIEKTKLAHRLGDDIDQCLDRIRLIHNFDNQLAYLLDARELFSQLKLIKLTYPYLAIDSLQALEERLEQAEFTVHCLNPQ